MHGIGEDTQGAADGNDGTGSHEEQ